MVVLTDRIGPNTNSSIRASWPHAGPSRRHGFGRAGMNKVIRDEC